MAAFFFCVFRDFNIVVYHQSILEIINLFIYHIVLLIGLLSCVSGKLLFRRAC